MKFSNKISQTHITNERIYLRYYFIVVTNNENYSFRCLSNNRAEKHLAEIFLKF